MSMLPTEAAERKGTPVTTGVLDYFPLAIAEIARVSLAANEQHNPGQPMHWAKEKSTDHADCLVRHLMERGTMDSDGLRHTAKAAWRALALLQTELEKEAQLAGLRAEAERQRVARLQDEAEAQADLGRRLARKFEVDLQEMLGEDHERLLKELFPPIDKEDG